MLRVFSGDDRETILVRNREEPKQNRLQAERGGARIRLHRCVKRRKKSAADARDVVGEENLEDVKNVARKQCENRHDQDGFQLFVVGASTTKVVA